ncbi:MAG: N-succinylarginine dihydrolase [Chlamydiales bacterium]|nr:N-succinylarginine dihydrolase [Chlamydiales bacterium]MCH9620395.1 N-succinylarginine dihydrolase [Chlamydiales bacterium]MCH9622959.1 N-succinylarginine dihydrolase [Chlamydiales bacterium]
MDNIIFDGLIGPTHHFGGLSFDNPASLKHKHLCSNPKQAALQGLKKMKLLMDLGIPQGIIPPHERPSLLHLRNSGFTGTDGEVIEKASKQAPELFYAFSSAAPMWVANSATISPSSNTIDGKLHISIANLNYNLHRAIESGTTYAFFSRLFPMATLHSPLTCGGNFGDEGAANHVRMESGEEIFVYGSGRQHKEASRAIARRHQVKNPLFLEQSDEAIAQGAFHNDLIGLSDGKTYYFHEKAYTSTTPLKHLPYQMISEKKLPLKEALSSYIFNSQIIKDKNGDLILIAPKESENLNLDWLPIKKKIFVDLSQSMHNGGGPACLSLTVPMTQEERAHLHQPILLTPTLYNTLVAWVEKYYRESLNIEELADPLLLDETREALDSLTQLLKLNKLYLFQLN